MNRKLLTVQVITVVLLALLAVFINFLTNDKNIIDSLSANGIGTNKTFGIVALITVVLVILEYIKLRDDKTESKYEEPEFHYPASKQLKFNEVWQSLIALDSSADALWREISNETLADFAEHYNKAIDLVKNNALFFSENNYQKLNELLKAADFYIKGKNKLNKLRLSEIQNFGIHKNLLDTLIKTNWSKSNVELQIRQNKRWLSRYKNLLDEIRSGFYNSLKK